MKRRRMLYVSPFPPLKSGISDYSVLLAKALSERFDMTLCTDDYEVSEDMSLPIVYWKNVDYNNFDYIVYNIGNNPEYHSYIYSMCLQHPGMIILHDLSLYYLFTGYYERRKQLFSKLYMLEGTDVFLEVKERVRRKKRGLLEQKDLASQYMFNREILTSGNKIMVHSHYSYERVKVLNSDVCVIHMIPQVAHDFEPISKNELLSEYGLPADALIVSSFGNIAETKLNHIVCKVISKIVSDAGIGQPVCYVMVGEGNYVDEYIDNRMVFKTGYVGMNIFDSFIFHSDLILNLRHPSMGETSAALIKILQMGKPCIINDEAWFSEIPDECAIKIPVENMESRLEVALRDYLTNSGKRAKLGEAAKQYIEKEYDPCSIVEKISRFLGEAD